MGKEKILCCTRCRNPLTRQGEPEGVYCDNCKCIVPWNATSLEFVYPNCDSKKREFFRCKKCGKIHVAG